MALRAEEFDDELNRGDLMPITDTLQNAKRLEATGLSAEQSQSISEIVEEAIHAGRQDLKDFIRSELKELRNDFDFKHQELRTEIANLRADFHSALRDQLLKFVAIMAMMFSIAVAIIKLFPDLN